MSTALDKTLENYKLPKGYRWRYSYYNANSNFLYLEEKRLFGWRTLYYECVLPNTFEQFSLGHAAKTIYNRFVHDLTYEGVVE